jgi:nitroreductase
MKRRENIMDTLEEMKSRHAVRSYRDTPIEEAKRTVINGLVDEANKEGHLAIQVFYDEPQAFDTFMAHYGKFSGVRNYLALVGDKSQEEAAGYYGERIVLALQGMGLNSCWVALTYGKGKVAIKKTKGQKILCMIAFGYGAVSGFAHKSKPAADVSSLVGEKPAYWDKGIEAALLAPTATNQQKFLFTYRDGGVHLAVKGLGFYTALDLGIVKYHFEAITGVKVQTDK